MATQDKVYDDTSNELAEGRPQAIAAFARKVLGNDGITVKAAFKGDCLYLLLEDEPVPAATEMTPFAEGLAAKLLAAGVDSQQLRQVNVGGQRRGESVPVWCHQFFVPEPPSDEEALIDLMDAAEASEAAGAEVEDSTDEDVVIDTEDGLDISGDEDAVDKGTVDGDLAPEEAEALEDIELDGGEPEVEEPELSDVEAGGFEVEAVEEESVLELDEPTVDENGIDLAAIEAEDDGEADEAEVD
ncbi:MAG: hypothetical protein AAGA67_05980, partial [Cyanobacteria bacterium P01_F01_bin.153]